MPHNKTDKGMDFAKEQLEKMGWKEGSGLGKKEAGISEALRPKLKFDSSGLGHSRSEEFTYHWWDHAFNKAASALEVKNTEEGPKVVKKDGKSKPGVSRKKVNVDGADLTYGVFQKSGILSNGAMREEEKKEVIKEDKDYSLKISDEELFKICGGRTAHKGARHGHRCTGKLARVAQQEALLLAQMQSSLSQKSDKREKVAEVEPTSDRSHKKKKKKKDKSAAAEDEGEAVEPDSQTLKRKISCHDDDQGEQENPAVDRPEKKRKKKKRADPDC